MIRDGIRSCFREGAAARCHTSRKFTVVVAASKGFNAFLENLQAH